MMIVFQTGENGLFVGAIEADESPLEPGVFLIPAGCVGPAPPPVRANEAAVWSGSSWDVIADHRGEVWYEPDRSPVVIRFLGDPSEHGLVPDLPPEPPPTSDDLKIHASSKRFVVETGGIVVDGRTVDTSRDSQSMISSACSFVRESGTDSIMFKSTSGFLLLSGTEMRAIGIAVGLHVQRCFSSEGEANKAIFAGTATSIGDVDAFFNWATSPSA